MSPAVPVVRRHVAVRRLLTVAAVVASAAGCAVSGGGSAQCAYRVTYEDRTYQDVANVDFTVGEKLGTAASPPCNDTGGRTEEQGTESTAYRVDGLDPDIAIAVVEVGDTPDEAVLMAVMDGRSLPPEVEKLRGRR